MPKGARLTHAERTRRQRGIFEVAASLFLRRGFAETSLRRIAEAAGVGKSTLYDCFPAKDDILLFILEEEMRLLNQAAAELAEQRMGASIKLRRLVELRCEFLGGEPRPCAVAGAGGRALGA